MTINLHNLVINIFLCLRQLIRESLKSGSSFGMNSNYMMYFKPTVLSKFNPPAAGVTPIEVPQALRVIAIEVARWCSYQDDHRRQTTSRAL